jgi:hypothetical protein
MNNSMWSIGFMTVQMRLRKLLKRLAASPMQKWEFLLAQVLARLLFLGPEVAVPLVFGVFAFGMPVRGSIWPLRSSRCSGRSRSDRLACSSAAACARSKRFQV